MACQSFLFTFLLTLATLHGIHGAVEYVVTNRAAQTPGGIKFNNDLGAEYTKQQMAAATEFIWRLFQQNTAADRRDVSRVTLYVDDMDGIAYTIPRNNEIHVGDDYIQSITGDIKWDFSGVLYHEMAHIWQWFGNGQASTNITEGIADFVRLKANYVPANWAKPGDGYRWDQGYSYTARFLDYCNDLRNGFVAELNKKMRDGYSDNFFVELLGKTVEQLWSDYKTKYGK